MSNSDYAALAEASGLARVGARPPFFEYLKEAWARRHFAIASARYTVETKNSRSAIGVVWIVLKPILTAAIYGIVFGLIMPSTSRPPNFLPFLFVGVFTFQFFTNSFSSGARAITGNTGLVQSLHFPRILLPVSVVLRQLFEMIPVMIALLPIIWIFGETPRWGWFMLIPIFALYTLFNLGVALIVARLSVHFPDLKQIIPFVTRLLFYGSGIFFSLEAVFGARPELLAAAQLNPVHDFITLCRAYMIDGTEPSGFMWIVAAIWTLVIFVGGVVYFWAAEEKYGND